MTEKNLEVKDKILALLKNYTLSTREISEEIGVTYATTLKHLEILHASQLLDNTIFGKTKVWNLKRSDPFDLDSKSILYLLCKRLMEKHGNYDFLEEILETFYRKAIQIHQDKLKNINDIELIKKYLELEKKMKWKDIVEYDIEIVDSNIIIKVFECKFKYGCCANLHDENIKIHCILGQKFQTLLNLILNKQYKTELIEFSIDPSICKIQLPKSNSQNR